MKRLIVIIGQVLAVALVAILFFETGMSLPTIGAIVLMVAMLAAGASLRPKPQRSR